MQLTSIHKGYLRTASAFAFAFMFANLNAGEARADGDGTHGQTLVKRGKGLSAASFGVGLSGRVVGGPGQAVTTGPITISGIPAGAIIEHAYLYWITYGTAGNASITLDGAAVTGALIGTNPGTCWSAFPTFQNFTYRVDVTTKVTGNGVHTLTGFPSATATADTQGASIFVVYTDPASALKGTVLLHDGAISMYNNNNATGTFTQIAPPAVTLSARLLLGVGDGEITQSDGTLSFVGGVGLPGPAPGNQHFNSSAGKYWDDRSYDVTAFIKPNVTNATWNQDFAQDCLAFAFSALTFQSAVDPNEDAGSVVDGGSSGSSGNGGAGGGTASSASGGPGAGGGPDASGSGVAGNPVSESSDGCGCSSGSSNPHATAGTLLIAALAMSWMRRRRRSR